TTAPVPLSVPPAGPEPRLALALVAPPGLEGRLISADGEPLGIDEVQVRLAPLAAGAAADPARLLALGVEPAGRDGGTGYVYSELAPGAYAIGIGRAGQRLATQVVEVPASGRAALDLVAPPLDPDATIALAVLGPDGEPIPDASVGASVQAEPDVQLAGEDGPISLVPRPDGTRALVVDPAIRRAWRDRAPGTVRLALSVTSPDHGTKRVEVADGETRELTVEFGPAALARVRLREGGVAGLAGALFAAIEPAGCDEEQRALCGPAPLSPAGEAVFGPLVPGEYDLVLSVVASFAGQPVVLERRRVTLVPGENELAVAPPELHRVRILALPRTQVSISGPPCCSGRAVSIWQVTDASGAAVFERLPAGAYEVSTTDAAERPVTMRLRLPGPAEVRFAPEPYDAALLCGGEGASGDGADGLRAGDLVIAVNGEPVTPARGVGLDEEEPVELTVLRDGATRVLRLPPKTGREPGFGVTFTYRPR
ncbi:MAG TPA: hypothetical protein VHF22_02785, partial [Planctomycetota bacterium]|nr:hypothetical protein [Planctomycetota bacterium]